MKNSHLAALLCASVGVGAIALHAQQSQCRENSAPNCPNAPCQIVPGGPINICNCCYAGNGLFQCCDNVACSDCIDETGD